MPTLNVFVSFEFDRDKDLRDHFVRQAEDLTRHAVRDCSLREAYPYQRWKNEAKEAIEGCDVVVVLIGPDTHNAPGVIVETDIARSLGIPIIQVRPQGRPYRGLARLDDPITWKWKTISAKLDDISRR